MDHDDYGSKIPYRKPPVAYIYVTGGFFDKTCLKNKE
jgi:hypothetical protein